MMADNCCQNGKCCAIIPAYEESRQIARIVRQTLIHADRVLVIDDGSSDDTFGQAKDAGALVLRHKRNLGKGTALLTGLQAAAEYGYEFAVTLDGDGQHDPDEIPKLLETLRKGADIVIGCRMGKPDGMPLNRLFTNMFMSAVLGILTKCRLHDTQSGFKALRIQKVRKLNFNSSRFDWESELIIKAARSRLRMCEVGIKSIYANHHRSKIKVVSDTYRFIKLVISNIIY
jgi:glycosyltransferase involved in cell wall biosynthesis